MVVEQLMFRQHEAVHAIIADEDAPNFGAAQLLLINHSHVVFQRGRVSQLTLHQVVVALREDPQAAALQTNLLELVLRE